MHVYARSNCFVSQQLLPSRPLEPSATRTHAHARTHARTRARTHSQRSAEALEAGGHLSLQQYTEVVGHKRAPSFTHQQRPLVYRCWQAYERAKRARRGWDRADLAAHLYRQLRQPGAYRGVPLDGIYRCVHGLAVLCRAGCRLWPAAVCAAAHIVALS
jgi:hypothetical protein